MKTITAVVPTFNEGAHIASCVESLLRQEGDGSNAEVLVVDGGSTDATRDIVRAFPEFGQRVRLLDNPRRFQVHAWNIGWRAAKGDYVAGVVAHAKYAPDYLHSGLEALARTGADAVGPVATACGSGLFGGAVAWCMSSPFGVGNARFRFTQSEEDVDSVCNIIMRRELYAMLGGYDERVPFDEDDEFNYRLRSAGGRIVVSPSLRIKYHVRETVPQLAKQMYSYGYWRRFTRLLHPSRVPARVYVPPLLVAGLAISAALAFTPARPVAWVVPALYAGFTLAGAVTASRAIGPRRAACVPFALATMHVSYGVGFIRALLMPAWRVIAGTAARDAER